MKKSVESNIKGAIESWQEISNATGLNKDLVWGNIQAKKKKGRVVYFTWTKVAVCLLILLMGAGWLYSFKQVKELRAQNIELTKQQENAKIDKSIAVVGTPKSIIHDIQVQVDTIIKEVYVPVNNSKVEDEVNAIKKENEKLYHQLEELKRKLNEKGNQYNLLCIDNNKMKQDIDLLKEKNSISKEDIDLVVNEQELTAMSEPQPTLTKLPSENKNKLKIVFFNKLKSTESEAPAKGGIRL